METCLCGSPASHTMMVADGPTTYRTIALCDTHFTAVGRGQLEPSALLMLAQMPDLRVAQQTLAVLDATRQAASAEEK